MDHSTQYTADDFLNQIKFWGIAPSFAFVAEPQTNGVAERFNRTLKEQVIHGRVFKNVEEVRVAVMRSRNATIAIGVSRKWASSHPWKSVRHMP